MKKILFFLIAAGICSCTSLQTETALTVHGKLDTGTAVYLKDIRITPELMEGLRDELPQIITCALEKHGFVISSVPGPGTAEVVLFLHKKDFQLDFKTYESVTLTISIKSGGAPLACSMHTVDTEKGIDSFAWTWALIDSKIAELAKSLLSEPDEK